MWYNIVEKEIKHEAERASQNLLQLVQTLPAIRKTSRK